tara:strand:+ start:64 stop:465 length:402 start_codon:yes stop_codon:yes gene_type:complete
MSVIEGKVWGNTEPIHQAPAVEVHRIKVDPDGYCSQHKHQSKINMFYVISGGLEIQRWKDYGLCDSTYLYAGDTSIVPAGEMHKFIAQPPLDKKCTTCNGTGKAPEQTEALEIYWAELNHHDIIRENVGGVGE